MSTSNGDRKVMAYRRENGRVGVRNHVVILPVDDISNAACEAVANNIKGTIALPHSYGRLQFGEDLDLHFRTMIGTGSNPNVAAVVVIGIEPGWTKRKIVDGIAETGKPVAGFSIEQNGDLKTIMDASRQAKDFVHWASELQREPCDISELWISTKCGESDTTTGLGSCPTVGNMYDKLIPKGIYGVFGETTEITGAEHICKARAATPEVGERWYARCGRPIRTRSSRPTRPAICPTASRPRAISRAGSPPSRKRRSATWRRSAAPAAISTCSGPPKRRKAGPGLYYMDTSSAAAECVTLMAAGGYVVHTFPTGQGNVIGNPIVPVIKITANPRTVRTMGEHIDVDVSGLLRRDMTIDKAGDALIDMVVRTANGRSTAAEALGHREFVMTKLYRSA
jgi:(2R)-sulfolactate sulfo-lyase subunit beta